MIMSTTITAATTTVVIVIPTLGIECATVIVLSACAISRDILESADIHDALAPNV